MWEVFLVIAFCAVGTFIMYGIWLQESDQDAFRHQHGVKPKYYSCVTRGDEYCSHSDWCEAEKILFPEQYEAEMKQQEDKK